jgi:hypothetical protein
MTPQRLDRIASVSWLPYLLLVVAAFALLPKPMPALGGNVQDVTAYFGTNAATIKVFVCLDSVASLLLLVFVVYLANKLSAGETKSGLLSWLALASGGALVAFEFASDMTRLTLAITASASVVGTGVLGILFNNFELANIFLFGIFLAAVGVGSLVGASFPRWFCLLTCAAGIELIVTGCLLTLGVTQAGLISLVSALIWIVVAGVVAARLEWRNSMLASAQLDLAGKSATP